MPKRRTHEEYIVDLENKNPNVEVLEQYINANTPIKHKCKIHNTIWKVAPRHVLSGQGCSKCASEKIYNSKAKTQEQYIKEVNEKNPNVEVIGTYVNSHTAIEHRCKKHNIIWKTSPNTILIGGGCKKCCSEKIGNALIKSNDNYIKSVAEINPNIEVLEEYKGSHIPILHKCNLHDVVWKIEPTNILFGQGCEKCKTEKISKGLTLSHEDYCNKLQEIDSNIIPIDIYINGRTQILHRCLIHNYEWTVTPMSVLMGHGCPKCHTSLGEEAIEKWLKDHNIKYVIHKSFKDCKDKKVLPFDFYLPKDNKCIEYDGKQHFESIDYFGGEEAFNITVKHDQIKNDYCKQNNIPLLRIPYYANIETELENFLLAS